MLTPAQQSVYRPLVDKAWMRHCLQSGGEPRDKVQRQEWYQAVLRLRVGVSSTKDASPSVFPKLVNVFSTLAANGLLDESAVNIYGFTPPQNQVIRRLAGAAWKSERARGCVDNMDFISWFNLVVDRASVYPSKECAGFTHTAPDHTHSFDCCAERFAILANDDKWMRRTSESNEKRLRFLISARLKDIELYNATLNRATGRPVTWAYVRGCYDQGRLLPEDLDDATAEALFKVFQMLDTHVRRLKRQCKAAAAGRQPAADPRQAAQATAVEEEAPF